MLVQHLKKAVEDFAARLDRESRLLRLARQGGISPEIITAYLSGVLFMIRHTPIHLELGVQQARARGREELATFFLHKLSEERGHDQWALRDFQELKRLFGAAAAQPPHASMVDLARTVEHAIARHPASYLAYILLAEYLTVLIGPAWLTALEQRCGIPRRALSVVSQHVELDQEHVAAGVRQYDQLFTEADGPAAIELMTRSIACYQAFYEALYQLHASTPPLHASR